MLINRTEDSDLLELRMLIIGTEDAGFTGTEDTGFMEFRMLGNGTEVAAK